MLCLNFSLRQACLSIGIRTHVHREIKYFSQIFQIAVLGKPTMRTAHNYFVVALAFSDLFLCLFSMPITLWELLFEQWPFGANTTLLCRCVAAGKVLPLFMSSMAIVRI